MSTNDIRVIEGPEAWHGSELAKDSRRRAYLDDSNIAELESALQNAKERGLAWRDMKEASDFPLEPALEKLRHGCGGARGWLRLLRQHQRLSGRSLRY